MSSPAVSYETLSPIGIPPQEAVRLGFGRLLQALSRLADPTISPEDRVAALGTAHDFIGALIAATNAAPADGPPAALAARLRELYVFWGTTLAGMYLRVDHDKVGEIQKQAREIARAWDSMLRSESVPARR